MIKSRSKEKQPWCQFSWTVPSPRGLHSLLDTSLDPSQLAALEFVLGQRELAVVQGPPGTGKTTPLVEVVRQAVAAGQKVLVCAPSNVAVDNLLDLLDRRGVKVVRLGDSRKTAARLRHLVAMPNKSLPSSMEEKEEGVKRVEEAEVVLGTLTSCIPHPGSLLVRSKAVFAMTVHTGEVT